jgi:WD40 repeat protein
MITQPPQSTEPGWIEDPDAAPHLVLRGPIDRTRGVAVVTVDGSPVLAVPAQGGGDLDLVRAVDLITGAVLPDRSGLRRAAHEVLALGAGRLLATLGRRRDAVVVRDAVTGVPVGVPLPVVTRGLALTELDGRAVLIAAGSGLSVLDVRTGELITRHDGRSGRHLVEHQGRWLIVAEEKATTLRLCDVRTGEAYGQPIPCDFSVTVSRLSAVEHDGRLLIAFLDGHTDGKVRLWDATAGAELPTAPPFDDVRELDVATVDGRPLLLAVRSGQPAAPLALWDLSTGDQVFPDCFAGYAGECARVALGSLDDGFFAVTVDGDGSSTLWVRSAAGTRRTVLTDGAMSRVVVGAVDGRPTVALGGADGALRLFDARTGEEFGSPFYGGRVSPSIAGFTDRAGRAVAVLGGEPLRLWDVAAGVPVGRRDRFADRITGFATGELGDGRTVLAAVIGERGSATHLTVWDPEADAVVTEVSLDRLTADTGPEDLVFTEIDGRAAVAVVIGRAVHSWDAATGEPLGRPYQGLRSAAAVLAAGRIGDRPVLAVGGKDKAVHVVDPATGAAVVPPMAGHSQRVTALAFGTAAGRTVVASGSGDKSVRVWDAGTGARVGGPWNGHDDRIVALHVAERDGEPVVVSLAPTGPPRMWLLRAPAPTSGHTDAVRTVAAGRWEGRPVFASGGADQTVRLWDAATGRPLDPAFTDHAAEVTHVAFAGPQRDILVTGDETGVVVRRRAPDGGARREPLARLEKRITGIGTAEVDGRSVVGVGTADGVLRIWDAETGEPRAELRTGADVTVHRTDLGALDGRLIALTIGPAAADDDDPVLTLWDVSAGEPWGEPMVVPEECQVGTLAMLDGRLVVLQGIDAVGGGYGYHGREAADVQVIDVATRTVLRRHRSKRGWSHHATVARSATGSVVLVTSEDLVAVVDPYETGGPAVVEFEYAGERDYLTYVAAAEVAGRTVVAFCDGGNALHLWDLDTRERLR